MGVKLAFLLTIQIQYREMNKVKSGLDGGETRSRWQTTLRNEDASFDDYVHMTNSNERVKQSLACPQ